MTRKERKNRSEFNALVKEARKYITADVSTIAISIHNVPESSFPEDAKIDRYDTFSVTNLFISTIPLRELKLFT